MDEQAMTENFSFWMPAKLQKSETGTHAGKRVLHGVASTEDVDAQNEKVLQQGIDFEPLLRSGFINYNHQPGPENLIGQPIEARLTTVAGGKTALYVKAVLFEGVPRADAAWNLINVLEKARQDGVADRRLGWSVEGGVLERRGNLIAKSVVRQLALTHEPVAYGTFADLAKSLMLAKSGATSSIADAAPLMLQNLAGSKKSAKQVCLALFGKEDGCFDKTGRFKKGRIGALEHLIKCEQWNPSEATDVCVRLFKAFVA